MEQSPTPANSTNPWLTVAEAADYLRLNKRTVQNYISRGAIKVYRSVTGTCRLRQEDLDEFLGGKHE